MTAAARLGQAELAATWRDVEAHAEGLHALTGGGESPVALALAQGGHDAARALLERLAAIFPGRLHVELQRHFLREEERRNQALADLARRLRLPILASNGVRYAREKDKELHDVLTSIRHHVTLDGAGRLLAAQRERHFKNARQMRELFADAPGALEASVELSRWLDFTLADLGYRFPAYPLPRGNAGLVPAQNHLERRSRALPAADGEGPGPDRERARDDREARSAGLLPDRLGPRRFCRRIGS